MMRIEKPEDLTNASEDFKLVNPGVFGTALSGTEQSIPDVRQVRNKYHVAPAAERVYNGIIYQSKKEAEFARHLDLLVRGGEIDFWLRQVPFRLPGDPPIIYRCDFLAFANDTSPGQTYTTWRVTVYEVKGYWTEVAKLKMKLFREAYPNLKLVIV